MQIYQIICKIMTEIVYLTASYTPRRLTTERTHVATKVSCTLQLTGKVSLYSRGRYFRANLQHNGNAKNKVFVNKLLFIFWLNVTDDQEKKATVFWIAVERQDTAEKNKGISNALASITVQMLAEKGVLWNMEMISTIIITFNQHFMHQYCENNLLLFCLLGTS